MKFYTMAPKPAIDIMSDSESHSEPWGKEGAKPNVSLVVPTKETARTKRAIARAKRNDPPQKEESEFEQTTLQTTLLAFGGV